MEIALLLGLILLNGLFAMSEIALVTARRTRLQKLVDEGDPGARAALELGEHPTRFLSTIQIGITSIGVLNGIVGETALAGPLAAWLQRRLDFEEEAAAFTATATVVVVITYASIVLGELLPKRLGQLNPEPIARIVARPMLTLAAAAKPFVRLLTGSTELLMRLTGVRDRQASALTEEDIAAMLAEGSDAGVIEQQEHQMVRNVFRLDEREILSLMVPRADIVALDLLDPPEDNLAKLQAAEHSRFPVCRGSLDEVIGIASAGRLLAAQLRDEPLDLTRDLQPAVFVPETLSAMELLEQCRSANVSLALVIDEYGEVQGLVTLQDLLEAITGEFTPRKMEDAWAVRREDGSWLIDGLIPLPELKDRLELGELPDEARGRYATLAGLLMFLLGRVPAITDRVDLEGWRFEIVDMDGKRIDKVLASLQPAADPRPAP